MLRKGESTQRIAKKFNVSRQAIDLHRRDFIERGLLPNQRALRIKKAPKGVTHKSQIIASPEQSPYSKDTGFSLDEQIDLIIDAFNALKRLPQLEKEVETYKKQYENALQEIENLNETLKKRMDQESRWRLTQRRNDTNLA